MQTKAETVTEILANTLFSIIISFIIIETCKDTFNTFYIVLVLQVLAIARHYIIRRVFTNRVWSKE